MSEISGHDAAIIREATESLAKRLGCEPDALVVHVRKTKECDHEWNNGGCNPTHCVKCGMSIMAHAFMECP